MANMISTSASQTTLSLQEMITTMKASGMADSAIKQTLMNDLNSGGPLFGAFKNKIKNTVKNGVELSSNGSANGQFVKAGVERFQWVTVGGDKVCPDCAARHGLEGTNEYFDTIGREGSGFSVCQQNCRCKILPVGYKDENLDKPLVRGGVRITKIQKKNVLFSYQDNLDDFKKLPKSDPTKQWVVSKVDNGITEHSELYRGLALKNKDVDDFVSGLKSSDFVFPEGHELQSFTANLELAEDYSRWRRLEVSPFASESKQIVMVFTSEKGRTLRGLDINKTALNETYESQLETILGGRNKYRFVGMDETSDGILFIQMEQIQ
jgi:hypothetical protein